MSTCRSHIPLFLPILCLVAVIHLELCRPAAGVGQTSRGVAVSEAAAGEIHAATSEQKSPKQSRLIQDLLHEIEKAKTIVDRYGYPAVFVAVLVEGFGVVAPGQTLLMAASFAAGRGDLNLIWILLLASVAAIIGNSLGYFIGFKGGRPLLLKLRLSEERLQRLEGYFNRYGKGVIVVARYFDGLRQLNGIVAGVLHMPWKTFTICNCIGAALWTVTWGLGSYLLEKEIAKVHLPIRLLQPLIAILILLAVLAFFVYILWPPGKTKS
jgi:membrane protein DedA with SNARE-associated domain